MTIDYVNKHFEIKIEIDLSIKHLFISCIGIQNGSQIDCFN